MIGVRQMRPSRRNRGRIGSRIHRFQLLAQSAGLTAFLIMQFFVLQWYSRFITDVRDAEKMGLRAASAHREIHRSISADHNVRQIQRDFAAFSFQRFGGHKVLP